MIPGFSSFAMPSDHEGPAFLLHDRGLRQRWRPHRRHEHTGRSNRAVLALAERYVERVIGSIWRECLDRVIVLGASGLQRVLSDDIAYRSLHLPL